MRTSIKLAGVSSRSFSQYGSVSTVQPTWFRSINPTRSSDFIRNLLPFNNFFTSEPNSTVPIPRVHVPLKSQVTSATVSTVCKAYSNPQQPWRAKGVCNFSEVLSKGLNSAKIHTSTPVASSIDPKLGNTPLRLAIVCGGPSSERGVSLNSARSLLDHLHQSDAQDGAARPGVPGVELSAFYISQSLVAFRIPVQHLYSNTPSDFDFTLRNTLPGKDGGNSDVKCFESLESLAGELQSCADVVFPVVHGQWGEDGQLQRLLEKHDVPFIGTGGAASEVAFDKFRAMEVLRLGGFTTLPATLLDFNHQEKLEQQERLGRWFEKEGLDPVSGRVVVKPCRAGSSIGVSIATGIEQAYANASNLNAQGIDSRVLVEMHASDAAASASSTSSPSTAVEFTVILVELPTTCTSSQERNPLAFIPTEVQLINQQGDDSGANPGNDDGLSEIFNYRRKYLPTQSVRYHTPPQSFSADVTRRIRREAERAFTLLGLRDFARLDGWVLPGGSENGGESRIVFSDVNIVSGMEQTSFMFQQAALVGLSHSEVLHQVISAACHRYDIPHYYHLHHHHHQHLQHQAQQPHHHHTTSASASDTTSATTPLTTQWDERSSAAAVSVGKPKQKVRVLFGGSTSERQVSLMSGTNVWLKLRGCGDLEVDPYLLAPCKSQGRGPVECLPVWKLPYQGVLRHTVEEVVEFCERRPPPEHQALISEARQEVETRMAAGDLQVAGTSSSVGVEGGGVPLLSCSPARLLTLEEFAYSAADEGATVFIAVHGGVGEDGRLQEILAESGAAYTGCSKDTAALCMDKAATGKALESLAEMGIHTAPKLVLPVQDLNQIILDQGEAIVWEDIVERLMGSSELSHWQFQDNLRGARSICVKPNQDGCSTGVACLSTPTDLALYLHASANHHPNLPPNTLTAPHALVELPVPAPDHLLFEPFIPSADVQVVRDSSGGEVLQMRGSSPWVEVTVGVLGQRGVMRALSPSVTVRESGAVLSLEEKFQGGTGVNLTPPPPELVPQSVLEAAKTRIAHVANVLGIQGFSRIDAFLHIQSGEIIVIEVNTVPGMTPSTVLFHQALAETPSLSPRSFLRNIVHLENKFGSENCSLDM